MHTVNQLAFPPRSSTHTNHLTTRATTIQVCLLSVVLTSKWKCNSYTDHSRQLINSTVWTQSGLQPVLPPSPPLPKQVDMLQLYWWLSGSLRLVLRAVWAITSHAHAHSACSGDNRILTRQELLKQRRATSQSSYKNCYR